MLSAFFMLGEVHSASVLPLETVKVSHHISVDIWHHLALIPSHVAGKAYEELDRVMERERWPNTEDEPNLPYIRAIIEAVVVLYPMGVGEC